MLSNLQWLQTARQEIEYLLVVDLEETDGYPTVFLPLLFLEDELKRAGKDSSLQAAEGRLVVIELGVVLRAVSDHSVSLSRPSLPAKYTKAETLLCEDGRVYSFENSPDGFFD